MTITEEAESIINGPRRDSYGPVEESFQRTANIWSGILNIPVSPQQVALCMIGLKLQREANQPARDNRVDIAGYDLLLDKLETISQIVPLPK